jgi:hypothetical protein
MTIMAMAKALITNRAAPHARLQSGNFTHKGCACMARPEALHIVSTISSKHGMATSLESTSRRTTWKEEA